MTIPDTAHSPALETVRRGLDAEHLGHLRHVDALSRLQDNDWSGMQGIGTSQEDVGGYRFQLAYTPTKNTYGGAGLTRPPDARRRSRCTPDQPCLGARSSTR